MELKDRLRKLDRFNRNRPRARPTAETADGLVRLLDAKLAQNAYGQFVLVRNSFDKRRLREEIGLAFSCDVAGLWLARICSPGKPSARNGRRECFDLRDAVFFDCETTGLAGGVGTYAFLVGLGFLSGAEFRVEQYFMQDFHQERAVLSAVAKKLASFESLVSFNGKCYDLPLLENRFVVNRVDFDSSNWAHLDLLFPSRRLWKRRIGECNLGNIEEKVLGVRRKIDVPSYLIPQIYFDYLRTGEAEPLVPVFHHNVYDILSLLKLSVFMDHALEDSKLSDIEDPTDLYSLGRIHESLGDYETSLRCFQHALAQKPMPEWEREIYLRLAFVCKKAECMDEAVGVWQNLTTGEFAFSLAAHEELAKYYEHRKKEYSRALSLVERAIAHLTLDLSTSFTPVRQRRLDSLEYRKARLERKIRKAAQSG